MLRARLRRPGHATLVAYVALFFAMSGTAYAAATIGSPDVKDNSLLSVDLRDGAAVKGVDVVDNTLTGVDVNEATLTGVAHRVLFDTPPSAADPAPLATIGTAAPYTIRGSCDGHDHVQAALYVRGPAGTGRGDFMSLLNDDPASVQFGGLSPAITPNADTSFLIVTGNSAYVRATVNIWFHSGATVAAFHGQVIADPRQGSAGCLVLGTLTIAV